MYKTKTLLDVFTYIKNKNFAIEYVYVNDAHHSVNDNEISIVYTLRQWKDRWNLIKFCIYDVYGYSVNE